MRKNWLHFFRYFVPQYQYPVNDTMRCWIRFGKWLKRHWKMSAHYRNAVNQIRENNLNFSLFELWENGSDEILFWKPKAGRCVRTLVCQFLTGFHGILIAAQTLLAVSRNFFFSFHFRLLLTYTPTCGDMNAAQLLQCVMSSSWLLSWPLDYLEKSKIPKEKQLL